VYKTEVEIEVTDIERVQDGFYHMQPELSEGGGILFYCVWAAMRRLGQELKYVIYMAK
jgi:hypothetical protein